MHFQQLGFEPPSALMPPVEDATHWISAGAVTIGVELRSLRDLGHDVGGPTVHVNDAITGHERLRFDLFQLGPHYHYVLGDGSHRVVVYDEPANGDMAEWVLRCLEERLPEMLRLADAGDLAERVRPDEMASAREEVRSLLSMQYVPVISRLSEPAKGSVR